MKILKSSNLDYIKNVNQQVAKLQARVYKLKGGEAKQKVIVENARLAVEEDQKKIEDLESITHK